MDNKINVKIEGTKIENGNQIGIINTGTINNKNSFNYVENTDSELKNKMSELDNLVDELSKKVEPQIGEQAIKDFKNLETEIKNKKPRRALYEAYTNEIINAASYCSTLVDPIKKVIDEILSFINF